MESTKLYMARCLQLARLGEYYVAPNPMVGAVLVGYTSDGDEVVLGEGWHKQYGGPHAEPNCLRNAEENHPEGIDYKHCTLYVSLEPCSHYGKTPPCAELIVSKGIGRVVIGCLDPNPQVAGRGVRMLQSAGIEVEQTLNTNLSYKKIQDLLTRPTTKKQAPIHMEFTSGKHQLSVSCIFSHREQNTLQAPTRTKTNKYKQVTLREILPL